MASVYIRALQRALPRLLASFNADKTSVLAGVGDRYHWSWKLIDFPNGTYQAAVHGLAILLTNELLPESLSKSEALGFIQSALRGLQSITAKNGSLNEALPNEASYCVTALVAADFLAARELLSSFLTPAEQQDWLEAIRPLIEFLKKQDEHHALISNHLASGALAMFRWHAVTGDLSAEARGRVWLERILTNQSKEGWFVEYGGADPGYLSWCITQLAQINLLRPDLGLSVPLEKALEFLAYAAHPDGSFGGSYGSRNTRFLLPGGIELLSLHHDYARALATFARESIRDFYCVTLDCIDAGNLVPFFNDYALAASAELRSLDFTSELVLPCHANFGRKWLADAGWLVDSGPQHYSIVNTKRGGAAVHFLDNVRQVDNPGTVATDNRGRIYSSQLSQADESPQIDAGEHELSLRFPMLMVKRPLPNALDFVILRLLSMTLLKSLRLGNLVKKGLVYLLISRKPRSAGSVIRHIKLGEDFAINDTIQANIELQKVAEVRHFSAIHMASQGYWQRGDGDMSGPEQ
jgi:hypothetical protein